MRLAVVLAVGGGLAALFILAGCRTSNIMQAQPPGGQGDAAWAMSGGSAARQGRTQLSGPLAGEQQWFFDTDASIRYAPAFGGDGTVYLSQERSLSALGTDGVERWRYSTGERIIGPPHVAADGRIWIVASSTWVSNAVPASAEMRGASAYVGGGIHIVTPEGSLDELIEISGASATLAVFGADDRGYLIVRDDSGDHSLLGLNPEGVELWRNPIEGPTSFAAMSTVGGYVIFGLDRRLQVWSTDGVFLSEIPLAADQSPDYAVDYAGQLYVADVGNYEDEETGITAFTPFGVEVWRAQLPLSASVTEVRMGPGDLLYVIDAELGLHALTRAGEELWSMPQAGRMVGITPAGAVYASMYGQGEYTLNVVAPDGSLSAAVRDFAAGFQASGGAHYYAGGLPLSFGPDGAVYATAGLNVGGETYPGGLHALDAAGQVLWSWPSGGGCLGPVVDAQGNCYVSNVRVLYAADAAGNFRWSRVLSGRQYVPPVLLPGGEILTCGDSHDLSAYRPDGSLAWEMSLGGYGQVTDLAVAGERIYVTSGYTLFCAAFQGELVYNFLAHLGIVGGAAVGEDGTAYIYDGLAAAYAVAPDGTEKWRKVIGERNSWHYPVIAGEETILFPIEGGVVALDKAGGERWRFIADDVKPYSTTPAVAADGTIYLPVLEHDTGSGGGYRGGLYALDPGGTERWHVSVGNPTREQPLVDGLGRIYLNDSRGHISVISPEGEVLAGQEEDREAFDIWARSMRLGPGGRLLISTQDGFGAFGP